MSRTKEFYDDLMIKIDREFETRGEDTGTSKELIFIETIIEDLSSGNDPVLGGLSEEPFKYSPPALPYMLNGFYMNEDEHSLTVYVSDFVQESELVTISRKEVESRLKKLHNFMSACISDPANILDQVQDLIFYDFVFHFTHNYKNFDDINYVFLTNGRVGEVASPTFKLNNVLVTVTLLDIERYRRYKDGQTIKAIDGDLKILEHPIQFVTVEGGSPDYDTYCFFLSGQVIFNFFDTYHYSLLNSNVRTYLQLRGSVNQGIMNTIENNPDSFLAYNNGLSVVASSVDLNSEGKIVAIHDFQIVNGGQTSASIYNAVSKNIDVSKIRVMVKLTVIKNPDKKTEIIKSISQYANTQNAIRFSDFSSNDEYNKALANFSRRIYSPAIGSKLQTKWYYENVAGTYSIEKSDMGKSFEKEYPKNQFFKKTDMAAYELAYQGFPAEACKGAQDAYRVFMVNMPNLKIPEEIDFKRLIAKKVLYDSVLDVMDSRGGQGKKAMTNYIVAYLSTVSCNNRINLDKIWLNQSICQELKDDITFLIDQMCPLLRKEAMANGKSVEMYCRSRETWNDYKNREFKVRKTIFYTGEIELTPTLTTKVVSPQLANLLQNIDKNLWLTLSIHTKQIASDTKGEKLYSNMCHSMATTDVKDLTESQIAYSLKILCRFYETGYLFPDYLHDLLKENQEGLNKLKKIRQTSFSKQKYYG